MSEKSFEYEKKCFINGVKYLLGKDDLYQADIAKGVKVTPQHISYILSGKKTGSPKIRSAIARFLGYDYHDIVKLGESLLHNRVDIVQEITGRVNFFTAASRESGKITNSFDISPIVELFPYFRDYLGFALTTAQAEGVSEKSRKENILYSFQQFLRHAMAENGMVSSGNGGVRLCNQEKEGPKKIEENKASYQTEEKEGNSSQK